MPATLAQTTPVVYNDDSDITDIPHDDLRLVPDGSLSLNGVRRVQIKEIIRRRCQEEFILFIPPTSKDYPPEIKSSRDIVLAPYVLTSSTPQQRDLAWKKHLEKRKVQHEGNEGYEFNVRIHSYPEHSTMDQPSLPPGELKYLLNPG